MIIENATTKIPHKMRLNKAGIDLEIDLDHMLQQDKLDLADPESLIHWLYTVCDNTVFNYGFGGWGGQDLQIESLLAKRFDVVEFDANDNEREFEILIETTLDNRKLRNPKTWFVKFKVFEYSENFNRNTLFEHKVEWTRLPNEALYYKGFIEGLKRRNLFNIIKT